MIPRTFNLDRYLGELDVIETQLEQRIAAVPCSMLTKRPNSASWCVAEVIEHLELTGRAFRPLWDAEIPKLKDASAEHNYALLGRLFLWSLEPPYRLKFKTAKNFIPAPEPSGEAPSQLLSLFQAMHDQVRRRALQLRGKDTFSATVTSPFAGSISYAVGLSFDIAAAHERRHLWQLDRILDAIR
jgi:hypothetical protein